MGIIEDSLGSVPLGAEAPAVSDTPELGEEVPTPQPLAAIPFPIGIFAGKLQEAILTLAVQTICEKISPVLPPGVSIAGCGGSDGSGGGAGGSGEMSCGVI